MNGFHLEIVPILGFAGIFIVIFLLAEVIRHFRPSYPELSRKFVHFSAGLTALSFPYYIKSHWTILLLAAGFSLIIGLAKMKGMLQSVHGIQRKSYGAMLFPVSVYLLFLLAREKPVLYFVSILVMTVSDTLAAVIGDRYGSIKYDVEGITKSLEGSTVFFFVTFLCVHLSFLLMTGIGKIESVLMALVIALLVTGFEAISPTGSDNFFVPLGTYFILAKMLKHPFPVMVGHLWILLVMILVTGAFSLKIRLYKTTGLVGMILVNYAAWTLCGFSWFLPLLLAQILLYLLVAYFVDKVTEEITGYQVKFLFYAALLPTLLIFSANVIQEQTVIFIAYLTSISAQMGIILYFFLSIAKQGTIEIIDRVISNCVVMVLCCALLSTFCVAFVPVLLNSDASFIFLLIVLGGTCVALCLFHIFFHEMGLARKIILRQRVRLFCTAVAVGISFLMQMLTSLA